MRALIRALDRLICRASQVYEFSADPGCILRLQETSAPHPIHLNSQVIQTSEPVLFLHLWNERLPRMPAEGPDLAWAQAIYRKFVYSLKLVAQFMQETPELAEVRAIGGVSGVLLAGEHSGGEQLFHKLGFATFPYYRPAGRFGEFWENFYSWLLIWTFNPGGTNQRTLFRMRRGEMWIARADFLSRYGH